MKQTWIASVLTGLLAVSLVSPAAAEETRTIEDESVYDLLVDRYFNKNSYNDYDIDTLDPAKFSGGDFAGIVDKLNHIEAMGFTMLSIGSVFSTDSYDGKTVLDYSKLERHFGTAEEFETMLAEAHELGINIMVDVPTQSVSADHVWALENPEWFTENEDGTLALDTANPEVQAELIQVFSDFIRSYEVDGLRLQSAAELDPVFIREFSAQLKNEREVYIVADAEMEPIEGLDSTFLPGVEEILRDSYKNTGRNSARVAELLQESEGKMLRVDSLESSRFTFDAAAENAFPPTRWRLIFAQLLTSPGIPFIQYGSEIAMNGEAPPESHQILNLKVDEELIEKIGDLNSLRNASEALRTGELEILHADNGWIVYKRWNEQDSWIVAINNTTDTQSLSLSADVVGEGKELRGLFESNIVRQSDGGEYRLTVDREKAEAFTVIEERGLNKAYLVALALVYILFVGFLWIVWKKGRQRKRDEQLKNQN